MRRKNKVVRQASRQQPPVPFAEAWKAMQAFDEKDGTRQDDGKCGEGSAYLSVRAGRWCYEKRIHCRLHPNRKFRGKYWAYLLGLDESGYVRLLQWMEWQKLILAVIEREDPELASDMRQSPALRHYIAKRLAILCSPPVKGRQRLVEALLYA